MLSWRVVSMAAALALALPVASCRRGASITGGRVSAKRTATPTAGTASALAPPPPARRAPSGPRGKAITIVYSSNMLGEYEPCG